MIKYKYRALLVVLISLLHLTCAKSILDVNKDYEGYWYNKQDCPLIIEIYGSSKAKLYEHQSYNVCGYRYAGEAYIRKDYIKIARVKFKVIEPPTKIDTIYNFQSRSGCHAVAKMTLEQKGAVGYHIRGKRVFYRLIFR
jgi:hypothetical protein